MHTDTISPAAIGMPFEGGFLAGTIRIDGRPHTLIVAPKATGEHVSSIWIPRSKVVPGARSYNDGLANTEAMAEAGSKIAKWARGLDIGGFTDWYLPSMDELELLYRNLKPTTQQNWCYARSGINLHALTPTLPYTPDLPLQTLIKAFQKGGDEDFAETSYWSSTQHASASYCAWYQTFAGGNQYYTSTSDELRARAVRRLPL